LPFFESFENPGFMSNGWKINNPDSLNTWTRTTPGTSSSYSIFIKNDSVYNTGAPANTYYDLLTTPFISFGNSNAPFMEFDMAYAKAASLKTDSLILSYSILCDTVWTPLLNLNGSQLASTSLIQSSFVPGSGDWKHYKIDLSALNNKRFVRLRFEDYSKGGNNLYLDNINIYSTSDHLKVNLYPNPVSEDVTLEVSIPSQEDVTIEVFDAMGRMILKQTVSNTVSFVGGINVSNLPEGMYFLRVIGNKEKIVKRLQVNH
ncbi:MAG: T9SS type A sorting domain-containing protein, partial [Cytophagaceae bacterium]